VSLKQQDIEKFQKEIRSTNEFTKAVLITMRKYWHRKVVQNTKTENAALKIS
jgi:hypothetical protein